MGYLVLGIASADEDRLQSQQMQIGRRQCEEQAQRLCVLEESFSSAQKEVGDLRSCLREGSPALGVRFGGSVEAGHDGGRGQRGRRAAELQPGASQLREQAGRRGRRRLRRQAQLCRAEETPRNSCRREECALVVFSQQAGLTVVQRRALDSESDWRGCERDLAAQLQEARGLEKKLQDEARNLGLRAQAAQESAGQVGLQLSEAQGRLAATEAELARAEAARRDLEFRLGSLQSALTRTLGIGVGRRASGGGGAGGGGRGRSPGGSSPGSSTVSRHPSTSPLRSSLSPHKDSTPDNTFGSGAISPERGDTPLPLPLPELDPEALRSGLRDFLQELRQAQRER
ncbi:hypothetical protein CRUP_001415, partial [Coryphaenoides rupestris]